VGLPNSVAAKVGSSRLAIFEALAADDLSGMVIPEIIRASGVPKSTVHRVVEDFEARGLIVRVGRRRKAPVFRLNPTDDEVVHVSRALGSYMSWRTGKELEAYRRQDRVAAQKLQMSASAASRHLAPSD
jgi:transposase